MDARSEPAQWENGCIVLTSLILLILIECCTSRMLFSAHSQESNRVILIVKQKEDASSSFECVALTTAKNNSPLRRNMEYKDCLAFLLYDFFETMFVCVHLYVHACVCNCCYGGSAGT